MSAWIRYTVLDRFQTTGTAPTSLAEYDRIVYTIGQESADPGGAAALLSGFHLGPITDQPGEELNGLTDGETCECSAPPESHRASWH